MTPKIAVAISGGIDSLVAAYLLKQQSKEVIGLHFITGYEKPPVNAWPADAGMSKRIAGPVRLLSSSGHPIEQIARQLDIPVFIADCRQVFQEKVIDYFTCTYFSGKTPNPCMICNTKIKFGVLLETARKLGASHLATGHYAKIEQRDNHRFSLLKGADRAKDQSYFLARLTQGQLSHARFPLSGMTKPQVRDFAHKHHLNPITSRESQDICFIGPDGYAGFLGARDPDTGRPGPIIDPAGKIIGTHRGLHFYTVGQRRGINCPAEKPYYVLALDRKNNRLLVGFKEHLYRSECRVSHVNWIDRPTDPPIEVRTRIRYRHQAADSTWVPMDDHSAYIRFKTLQKAITPGQAAVCYLNDQVVAGGWIDG